MRASTLAWSLSTRDTVEVDTSARAATSRMVVKAGDRFLDSVGGPAYRCRNRYLIPIDISCFDTWSARISIPPDWFEDRRPALVFRRPAVRRPRHGGIRRRLGGAARCVAARGGARRRSRRRAPHPPRP